MENLDLQGTNKTPTLKFDAEQGSFLIEGRSIPENSIGFYRPIFEWMDNYVKTPQKETFLDVKLEYFNTSSSKCLVEIFRKLERIHENGHNVQINWFFEEDDEDMEESGEDFQEIIDVPIVMKVLK